MRQQAGGRAAVVRRIKDAVYGSRLYAPARTAYLLLFNHENLRYRAQMRKFYGQFFRRGDLVFDIGANVGEYAEMLASVGAKVVAAEPNPACCQSLYRLAHMRDVRVEGCAVGAVPGNAKLRICSHSELSTLSDEWYENSKGAATYQGVEWVDEVEVPVVTLDLLAKRHGVPVFVKIDVEGFEENVIAGMSFRPRYLSFEFSNVRREGALRCIEVLGKQGYEFNPMLGREFWFQFSDWKAASETAEWLRSYRGKEEFGDVFGRFAK